jgi:ribonuclease HI
MSNYEKPKNGPDAFAQAPWVIYCDGSAAPNPGRMGIGVVLTEPDGTRHMLSRALHANGCNNEAELLALMAALQELKVRGAKSLLAYSDNSILVEQLGRTKAKPVLRLAPLFDEARMLLNSFEQVCLKWLPRHRNGEADALARAALGLPPKLAVNPRKKNRKRAR